MCRSQFVTLESKYESTFPLEMFASHFKEWDFLTNKEMLLGEKNQCLSRTPPIATQFICRSSCCVLWGWGGGGLFRLWQLAFKMPKGTVDFVQTPLQSS